MKSPARAMLFAAAIWLAGAGAGAAQIVVLNARGPSAAAYPQGAVLAAGRVISLKAGDQLEVVDATGSHVFNGPMSLPAGQIASGSKAALQDIFRRANASRPGIAAVRGFSLEESAKPAPPSDVPPLWRLDITAWQQAEPSEARSFCVMKGQGPVLTRSAAGADGRLEIYSEATHATRVVTWPRGAGVLRWPDDLTYAEGEPFSLNLDAAGATEVRWRTVPSTSSSLTAIASALLDNGCYDQLDSLQSMLADK